MIEKPSTIHITNPTTLYQRPRVTKTPIKQEQNRRNSSNKNETSSDENMNVEHPIILNNDYFPIDVTSVIIRSPASSIGTDWLDSHFNNFEHCKETFVLQNRITKLFQPVTTNP